MQGDWALVVGINRYPLAGVNPLDGAVRDAEKFHEWILNPNGGNVDPLQAKLLTSPTNPGGTPRPVFSEIYSVFENLLLALDNQGGSGRRLYIYLSGHGISPSGQESMRNSALLMSNAKAPNLWHCFAGSVWAEGARSAAVFREVVLIMDCCRDLKNNATIVPHLFGDPVGDSKDCHLIEAYATGWDSKARELPFPPDNHKQGVFTHSVLEVLKAGQMTGPLFKASVKTHLARALKDEKKAQEPQIGRDEELVNITFNEQAALPKTPVMITGPAATLPVIEFWPEGAQASQLAVLDDWAHDGIAWKGTLKPGKYELRLPAGGGRRLNILAGVPEEASL